MNLRTRILTNNSLLRMHLFYILFFFLWISLSPVSKACEFDLRNYVRPKNSPVSYTLALLDRSMVLVHSLETDTVPLEVQAFIHSSALEGGERLLKTKSFPRSHGCPEHFVVQLKHRKAILRSADLTDDLFKDEEELKGKDEADLASDSEDDDEGEDLEEELEYAASMVLFPIEDSDKVLAYLLGGWPALLNTTSVVPAFGLKVVTSMEIAATLADESKSLTSIKEIKTETRRLAKPMRGTETQQKGLGKISDFGIDPSSDGLEKVRIKPIPRWGNALVDGDDFFKFRLTTKNQKTAKKKDEAALKRFNQRPVMHEVAKEVYKVYRAGAIHTDFLPYLDEPVLGDSLGFLNKALAENWEHYFKEDQLLYMHWTFWFRARGEEDIGAVIKKIKESRGVGTIAIGGQYYKPTQLVRSLPIPFDSDAKGEASYYWFDRGAWYRMPAARFEIIRKRIADITVPQSSLFLPDYVADPTDSEDYKELAYNKAAVEFMRTQIGSERSVAEAILLDRENVPLGGRDDKFEFADILMQRMDGKYFLIHVKRERSRQIDHHRTQAERCALYLGENLDRGALPGLLIIDILEKFYENYITLPKKGKADPKTGETKEAIESWSTNFREKVVAERRKPVDVKGRAAKKKNTEEFFKSVKDHLLNVRTKERTFIKRIVTCDRIKPLIVRFEPYEEALGRCLDALEDYVLHGTSRKVTESEMYSPIVSEDRIVFVGQFFERVLAFLEKHASLARKHQGILPQKDRENITVVLAIIGDGSGKDDFHRQQLWGMDQTRKLVEKQGFGFQVAFIKDKTKSASTFAGEEDKGGQMQTTEEDSDSDIASSPVALLPLSPDQQAFEEAKRRVEESYTATSWYRGVKSTFLQDDEGQKYVRVVVDSSKGDCCFHALLDATREKTIADMQAYIDESETALASTGIANHNYVEFLDKCTSDFWKRVGDDSLLAAMEAYLKKIEVLAATGEALRVATNADLDFTALKEQKEKARKDLNKKRPRDAALKAEKERKVQALTNEIAGLEVLEKKHMNGKMKSYIKYKLEFQRASAARKKEILADFYLTKREWFDPSAIMHLGPRFGFKAKIFRRDDTSNLLSLYAQTPDADMVGDILCRLAVYVNNNHYDLLYAFD